MRPGKAVGIAALIALLTALPWLLPWQITVGDFAIVIGLHHLTACAIFVVMAMGLNLSIGFAGLLDLGFIAFVAVGSYLMSILLTCAPGVPWWGVIPLAIVAAAAVRVALGLTCLRLRGDYLAIVTLGFGEIVRVALKNNLFGVTGGPDGIFLGPKVMPALFGPSHPFPLYYLSLAAALVAAYAVAKWRDSALGRAMEAVREDEIAAASSGVRVFRTKLWAYGLGGGFAGLAGALYALYNTTSHPTDYEFVESVKVVVMVVLGGMGSVGGVAAGAVLFILLLEVFRGLAEYRVLIFGAVLVALMIYRPQGLAGRKR